LSRLVLALVLVPWLAPVSRDAAPPELARQHLTPVVQASGALVKAQLLGGGSGSSAPGLLGSGFQQVSAAVKPRGPVLG